MHQAPHFSTHHVHKPCLPLTQWKLYICFPQYPSLIIYTRGKKNKESCRDDATGAVSAHLP